MASMMDITLALIWPTQVGTNLSNATFYFREEKG